MLKSNLKGLVKDAKENLEVLNTKYAQILSNRFPPPNVTKCAVGISEPAVKPKIVWLTILIILLYS